MIVTKRFEIILFYFLFHLKRHPIVVKFSPTMRFVVLPLQWHAQFGYLRYDRLVSLGFHRFQKYLKFELMMIIINMNINI